MLGHPPPTNHRIISYTNSLGGRPREPNTLAALETRHRFISPLNGERIMHILPNTSAVCRIRKAHSVIASMGSPTITKPFVSILTLSPPVLTESLLLSSVQGIKGVVFNNLPSAPHPLLSAVVWWPSISVRYLWSALLLNPQLP